VLVGAIALSIAVAPGSSGRGASAAAFSTTRALSPTARIACHRYDAVRRDASDRLLTEFGMPLEARTPWERFGRYTGDAAVFAAGDALLAARTRGSLDQIAGAAQRLTAACGLPR
jgi:hypothetical protein